MKTVAAEIQSSTPVTISKAASVLSKFVSAETGASQAVNAYLRRATAALDELVRLHSKSDRKKHKKHKSDSLDVTATAGSAEPSQGPTAGSENGKKNPEFVNNEGRAEKRQDEGNMGEDTERRKHKKKKNCDTVGDSEVIGAEIENIEVDKKRENGFNVEIGEPKKKDKKKRKNREVEEGSRDETDDQRSSKKKKRRKGGEDDN